MTTFFYNNNNLYASLTKDYDIHLLNDSSVKVPFMTSHGKQFMRAFDGFRVLGMVLATEKAKTSDSSPCTFSFQMQKTGFQIWLRS